MKVMPFVLGLALVAAAGSAAAATHSDFSRTFPLDALKTFEFKPQRRISRDPLANNSLWAEDVRAAIRGNLEERGLRESLDGRPDFYVAFYVGLKERYDVNAVDYGMPLFGRGRRGGWRGWPGGYDVWSVPYTESTLILDVIDAHTNQLVWRGYDTGTLDAGHPDRTLARAVDNVLSRFRHDRQKAQRG